MLTLLPSGKPKVGSTKGEAIDINDESDKKDNKGPGQIAH